MLQLFFQKTDAGALEVGLMFRVLMGLRLFASFHFAKIPLRYAPTPPPRPPPRRPGRRRKKSDLGSGPGKILGLPEKWFLWGEKELR